ncbi:MAG: hypothetical protein R6X20_12400 [Phycisphaerae bacterium]
MWTVLRRSSGGVPVTPIYEQVSVKPEAVLTLARRLSGGWIASSRLFGVDAWNRLVAVYEDADESGDLDTGEDTLVVTYEYDGQKRRIETDVAGESGLDTYYNTQWQVLEVHEGGDAANPLKQFVWDVRYVDSPVVRFHDADTDGTIDDTLYYTTDANMNVTALVDTDGVIWGHNTIFPRPSSAGRGCRGRVAGPGGAPADAGNSGRQFRGRHTDFRSCRA